MKLQLLTSEYLPYYLQKQPYTLQKHFNRLVKKNSSKEVFDFYLSSSAVYSSVIEGNPIDIESYWKYRDFDIKTNTKPYKEIQDLLAAYQYAQQNRISWRNVAKAHKILSVHVLQDNKKYQGKIRDKAIGIYEEGHKLIYLATAVEEIKPELKKLFSDIKKLLIKELSIDECFYYAAMIHLRFSQIHPFADGNGRSARLLEKWFLAEKLGQGAWFIQSEKYYQKNLKKYYQNINLGTDYQQLNYDLCLPFLLLLAESLKFSK